MANNLSRHSHSPTNGTKADAHPPLSEPQRELIAFFVNAAQAFGLPKSYGEIFGLYFASEPPLALDDVVARLQISKGSASQGIRFLRSINALNSAYLPGDRRDHYTAETSLRRIADGFIGQRIRPQLKDGATRLRNVTPRGSDSSDPVVLDRIDTISSWTKKADLLFPVVSKFLGTTKVKDTKPTI
ncbi:hypothetical protein [Pelagicoccus sp. SDUM812002]|uniref:GbsR/MarR family transcriptional regulator n=1 Tax=Pelagicoccus sp. SDUM812002 TaxID=3041266 RepID=UPI00280E27E6|nr:hypothetical protein [Pelagicoccus sp. SDUM812002]MDQ8186297.1 hypothetical protein [Pelagicoccus sp. SDUM812002]